MKLLNLVLIAYSFVLIAILHTTLLFCGGGHCIVSFEKPPVSNEIAYHLRVTISALLPFELKTMQVMAQWIVIGEIMLVFIWTIKRLQNIICYMVWVVLAFLIVIALLAFFSHNNLSKMVSETVASSNLVSQ
jgi:hypothetical protein